MSKNILILTSRYHPYFSGPALQARQINSILEKKKFKIKILTQNYGQHLEIDSNVLLKPSVKFNKFIGNKLRYMFWAISSSLFIIKNKKNISVIHSLDLFYPTTIFSIIARLCKIPIIAKSSIDGVYSKKGFTGNLKRYFYKKNLIIVSISNNTKNELLRYGFPINKIRSIPNGVDLMKHYKPSKELKRIMRNKYNISMNSFVCIYTGSLNLRKRVIDLLEVFSLFCDKVDEAIFVIAGSFQDYEYTTLVNKFIIDNALKDKVLMIEHTSQVDELYKISDIFLFASQNEGLPNSLLEAMASGLPVITRDISGCNDLIENGINGYLIANNNQFKDSFLERLFSIYNNPKLQLTMSNKNEQKIRKHFNIENIATEYQKLYLSVSKQKN